MGESDKSLHILGLIHAVSGSRGKRKEKKREGNVYFSSFFLVIL
jgi:hypothetical protein